MCVYVNVYICAMYIHVHTCVCTLKIHTSVRTQKSGCLKREDSEWLGDKRYWLLMAQLFIYFEFGIMSITNSKINFKEPSIKYNRTLWSHEKQYGTSVCAAMRRSSRHIKWIKTNIIRWKTTYETWLPLWKLQKGYVHIYIQHTDRHNFFSWRDIQGKIS